MKQINKEVSVEVLNEVIEALRLARTYVAAMHSQIKSATGVHDNIVQPDLEKIDKALSKI